MGRKRILQWVEIPAERVSCQRRKVSNPPQISLHARLAGGARLCEPRVQRKALIGARPVQLSLSPGYMSPWDELLSIP